MTNEFLRFVAVRPPEAPENEEGYPWLACDVDAESSWVLARVRSAQGEGGRVEGPAIGERYFEEPSYVFHEDREMDFLALLSDLRVAVSSHEGTDEGISKSWLRPLWDSYYAHCLTPESAPDRRERIAVALKSFRYLEVSEANGGRRPRLEEIALAVPRDLYPKCDSTPRPAVPVDELVTALEELEQELASIEQASREIDRAHRSHVSEPRPEEPLPQITIDQSETEEVFDGTGSTKEMLSDRFDLLAEGVLSERARRLLLNRSRDFENLSALEIVDQLGLEVRRKATAALRGAPPAMLRRAATSPRVQSLLELASVPFLESRPVDEAPEDTPPLRAFRPLGVGDLLVVRQTLTRYEDGEIAHIENVMASEHRGRKHRRLRQTEETQTIETEEIREDEQDLQTTERFELEREVSRTIEQERRLDAGVSVSASYGPVKVTAHSDFASRNARTESFRSASSYAKDVTERSRSKIVNRVREERVRRTLSEVEETNEHGFDNTSSDKHVSGIYRWVNKFYRADVVNYGRRLMFEFLVPEPAAYYRQVSTGADEDIGAPPPPPTVGGAGGNRPLKPSDLNAGNYMEFLSRYAAEDVEAYPAARIVLSQALAGAPSGSNNPFGAIDHTMEVPTGYFATGYTWIPAAVYQANRRAVAPMVTIGGVQAGHRIPAITGKVAIAITGSVLSYSLNVSVTCFRSSEKVESWQLDTFQKIMLAYNRALGDYQERVEAAKISRGVQIQGQNPETNRRTEREELRKSCLRLLTRDFDRIRVSGMWRLNERFDAMRAPTGTGYPEIDVSEAAVEGRIIQFFEQSFEWENLTYVFYPYFWGRKGEWSDVSPLSDSDPQFRDFLRAGAARVVVPIRENHEQLVLKFIESSEIWNGGEPPVINDPTYLAIVDEIKAAQRQHEGNVVDSWEVMIPTELVRLQDGSELPVFEEAGDARLTGALTHAGSKRITMITSAALRGRWRLLYRTVAKGEIMLATKSRHLEFHWPEQQEWLEDLDARSLTLESLEGGQRIGWE